MKTINLTGDVGWEITDRLVSSLLPKDGKEEVVVNINSYGGEVFEAFAIYNTLRSYPGSLTTVIKGVAASAAATIFLAGKIRAVYKNSVFMAHEPWLITLGQGDELISRGKMLNDIRDIIAGDLMELTGKSREETLTALKNELWLVGWEDIIDSGVAKELYESEKSEDEPEPEPVNSIQAKVQAIIEKMKTAAREKAENGSMEKVAASIKAAHITRQTSPLEEGEKNTKEEDGMDKAELKTKFPSVYEEILNEGKGSVDVKAATDEALKQERANIQEMLILAGIPEETAKTCTSGVNSGEFAKAELKKHNEARTKAAEEAAKNGGGLKSLGSGNQIPNDSKVDGENQELAKWDKLYGKKEGEK